MTTTADLTIFKPFGKTLSNGHQPHIPRTYIFRDVPVRLAKEPCGRYTATAISEMNIMKVCRVFVDPAKLAETKTWPYEK
jgi:hypothetical protein